MKAFQLGISFHAFCRGYLLKGLQQLICTLFEHGKWKAKIQRESHGWGEMQLFPSQQTSETNSQYVENILIKENHKDLAQDLKYLCNRLMIIVNLSSKILEKTRGV